VARAAQAPTAVFAGAIALFAVAVALGGGVIHQAERVWRTEQRAAAGQRAATAAFALEQEVSRAPAATYTLAALVQHDPAFEGFEEVADRLMPHYDALDTLQLAPGGVITRIHPLEGHEAALGHDLLNDPDRRFQALEAMRSRRLTVAGPFELRQGGVGLIGRLAVFLPAPGQPGGERFWGFVTAVIRLERLLRAARLEQLGAQGQRYALLRADPERGGERCFYGCEAPLDQPVTFPVSVPNGSWTLALAPDAGWPAPPWGRQAWPVAVAIALAFSVLGWKVLEAPARLQQEVAARTAELARTNAALADEMRRLRAAEEAARTAEEQLRQAHKMEAVGRLAGGVAHDFNNLLTGILGEASLLVERTAPGSEEREAAEAIASTSQRAADLTRRLLGFARREPVRHERFDAHAVVRELVRLLSRTLDARITVETRLGAPRATVVGDPGQLQQALLNLALNARDAMPDGGHLVIETAAVERDAAWLARHPEARAGPHLAIAVTDSGPGVPAELQPHIFEPFFTTKRSGQGTGLGLPMVYAAATAHGGAVELERPPGGGAQFVVSLPLADGEATAPPAPAARAEPARGSGCVLVIDDHEVPRGAALRMLRSAGFAPHGAASGEEGLAWFREHAAEVRAVLLDVAMPGMDGLACREALLRLRGDVPIVFTSGYTRDGRAQALAARGEAGFLPKPFDARELAAALERALAGRTD